MADSVVIQIDTKVLDRIVAKTGAIREDAVREAAFAVEAKAKANFNKYTPRPVDTGTLRNSIYTTFENMPELDQNPRSLKKKRNVDISHIDRTPLPKPRNGRHEDVAFIGPSVNYGIYVEFGTTKMAARPYLADSVKGVQKDMIKQLRRLQNGK